MACRGNPGTAGWAHCGQLRHQNARWQAAGRWRGRQVDWVLKTKTWTGGATAQAVLAPALLRSHQRVRSRRRQHQQQQALHQDRRRLPPQAARRCCHRRTPLPSPPAPRPWPAAPHRQTAPGSWMCLTSGWRAAALQARGRSWARASSRMGRAEQRPRWAGQAGWSCSGWVGGGWVGRLAATWQGPRGLRTLQPVTMQHGGGPMYCTG